MAAEEPKSGATVTMGDSEGRDAELRRAIEIAREAGLENYRVEMSADGTVTISVGPTRDSDELPPAEDR
ncbi:hypothetical protein GRI89_01470 [Altererythrobacter salegens]|uniref:Uncharacterized protein n=1 Tax=Croceibacterium salegens TaxID=1737568 RepID=A0A6I4SQX2_9SPHN|nr:hypothetical protein [Croceibacterium salegens]